MESVVFDGREFVKASVLAEKFRYTQDYLGQLCRGKKVDARLVGRAWYINLDSLNSHKNARYKDKVTAKSHETVAIIPSVNYLSRIDVEPILKQKTVKIMKSESGKLTEVSMKYEGDDYSLIPRVNKSAISSRLHIVPAEAEKIKVHTAKDLSHIINFKAEPLADVFLSGAVLVEGIEEVTEENQAETRLVEEVSLEAPVVEKKKQLQTLKIRTLGRLVTKPQPSVQKVTPAARLKPLIRQPSSYIKHPTHSFTPQVLKANKPVETLSESSFLLPIATLLVGLISGFFILTTEVLVETTATNSYTHNFVINAENVTQAAKVTLSWVR